MWLKNKIPLAMGSMPNINLGSYITDSILPVAGGRLNSMGSGSSR